MFPLRAIFLILFYNAFIVAANKISARQNENGTISWVACSTRVAPPPFQCANFTVPLDYADKSKGSTTLAVIRFPASVLPSRGSMFMNPGGPGASGVEFAAAAADIIQAQIGGDWDILSWDPRGVGSSGPHLVQFRSDDEELDFWGRMMSPGQFESHGNLTNPDDVRYFMSNASIVDERLQALNDLLIQRNGDNLKYVGSCAVVRDLAGLVDAIDGPGADINFMGYSYGSLLSIYLTQMFPERVGLVYMDGIVDPEDYSNAIPALGWDLDIADAGAVWKGFTEACVKAGTIRCPLAAFGRTADDLDKVVGRILNDVYVNFTTLSDPSWSTIVELIFSTLYSPRDWADMAAGLANLASGLRPKAKSSRRSPFVPLRTNNIFPRSGGGDDILGARRDAYRQGDYSILAISCGDSIDSPVPVTTEEVFNEIVRISQTHNSMFGSLFNFRFFCHRWTTRAVERYTGPFNKPTKNVVLVLDNESDPITPFRSAKLVASKAYLGSHARLVLQQDFGHTTGSEKSNCTDSVILGFVRGQLPADLGNDEPDVLCDIQTSILGLPPGTHFDNVISENGDALTSGQDDPGLQAILHPTNGTSHNGGTHHIVLPGLLLPLVILVPLLSFV